jgi:Protein of unknown function (DUF3631)
VKSGAKKKWHEKLAKLFGMLGSANSGEREAARRAIDAHLAFNKKTWNDLTELLQTGKGGEEEWRDPDEPASPVGDNNAPDIAADRNPFDLVCSILQDYLYFKHSPDFIAVALWTMHTFVFDRFMHTPRLALLSPVNGCGKSTVLDVLAELTLRAEKFDHTTAAAAYRFIDQQRPTLLFDEGDNQELKPGRLLAVLNSGHGRNGRIVLVEKGKPRRLPTFAPAAFAAIWTMPVPLMRRSIVIRMERAPSHVNLKRFDSLSTDQKAHFDALYEVLFQWSRRCELDRDPAMPKRLHNRRADNWRVLLAIADACDRGSLAREAAVAMSRQHEDEDAVIELLTDVRKIFDVRNADRLASVVIVHDLHEIEDAAWSEWRGIRGDQQPRKLSQTNLSSLLRPFHIKPRSIWPLGSRAGDKGRRGYYRHQFEAAWKSYCSDGEDDTATHTSNIRALAPKRARGA